MNEFKPNLLKYEPEGDKSTMASFMAPFISPSSEQKQHRHFQTMLMFKIPRLTKKLTFVIVTYS